MASGTPSRPPGPNWMPSFRVQIVSAVATTTLFILWIRGEWGGPAVTIAWVDLVSTLVPAAAGWACWIRLRRVEGQLKRAWGLLAAACLSWALGQAYWTFVELRTGLPPATPGPQDIGYLLLIPLAAVGVMSLVRYDGRLFLQTRSLLDGAIISSSFIFAAFALGLERIVLESARTDWALIVNLLYPFGDGLVVGVVLMRLSRSPPAARGAIALLATGFLFLGIADLWFLVVDAQGDYATGGILDAFWIMGFQMIGLAAMRPANLDRALDSPLTWSQAMIPMYPFMASTVFAGYAEVRDGYFSDTLFWTALVVVMLVLVRLGVMVYDNVALARTLRAEQDLRTQMLNNITHDLVSPLSSVQIQLKLLAEDGLGPRTPRQEHALAVVQRNVHRVARLSADLKDLANLEAHRLSMLPTECDLAVEVRRAAASFENEAQQRGITLAIDAPPTVPLRGDAGRLGQVLDNLLSNALKFTPSGGRIGISVQPTDGSVVLRVTDTGRGLTPDEIGRLFRPFSQVHQPGEIKERGTGLGLFISRAIAEGHGGTLQADSPGRGLGTVFEMRLPHQPPLPTTDQGLRS